MEFFYKKGGKSEISNDRIFIRKAEIEESMTEEDKLKERTREQEEKLMFSYAMVRSTKLNLFESLVDMAVERAKNIPTQLEMKGKLGLNPVQVNKHIGQLLSL